MGSVPRQKLEAGGKPSTRFPPGGLLELCFFQHLKVRRIFFFQISHIFAEIFFFHARKIYKLATLKNDAKAMFLKHCFSTVLQRFKNIAES